MFLGWGVQEAEVQTFVVDEVSSVSSDSFEFSGEIAISNPSSLPLPITDISYELFFEGASEPFSSGSLDSFVISPGGSSADFSQQVLWPSSEQLSVDSRSVIINGSVVVGVGSAQYDLVFEDSFSVADALPTLGSQDSVIDSLV